MDERTIKKMIQTAMEQIRFSYAPYSDFKVGASLLSENGDIFTGCNIENAAYSPTNWQSARRFSGGQQGSERLSGDMYCGWKVGECDGVHHALWRVQTGDDGILQSGNFSNHFGC